MGFESDFDEKIDVIDLIINVLKEHEKKLDELVSRLESTDSIEKSKVIPKENLSKIREVNIRKTEASILLHDWVEFRKHSQSSELVVYDCQKELFTVSSINRGVVYSYTEKIPFMEIRYSNLVGKIHIDSIDVSSADLLATALQNMLNCGLRLKKNIQETSLNNGSILQSIFFYVDSEIAREWLAFQLEIDDGRIINGKLHN